MQPKRGPSGIHGVWVNGSRVFDGKGYVEFEKGPGLVLTEFDQPARI